MGLVGRTEVKKRRGRPPNPDAGSLTAFYIRVKKDLKDEFREACEEDDVTMSGKLNQLIQAWLRQRERR